MSKEKEPVHVRWVHACVDCGCGERKVNGCSDDDHYHITFEIPGVKKEDIELKITPNNFGLEAKRSDGKLIYISEGVFRCDADDKDVKADYENGLLKVTVPYECPDPLKNSQPVSIA